MGPRRLAHRFAVLAAILATTQPSDALAGLRITSETAHRGGPSEVEHGQILIEGQRLRLELETGRDSAAPDALVFRGDRKLVWLLYADEQSYAVLDREELERLRGRLESTRAEVEARLATLTREERILAERALGTAGTLAPGEPETARETDERREIDGHPCRRYLLERAGAKVGDVWVTPFGELGVKKRHLRVFRSLADFQRRLVSALGRPPGLALASQPFEVFDRLDGFPILIRRFAMDGEEVIQETRFTQVEPVDTEEVLFEVPEGYALRPDPAIALAPRR